MAHGRELFDRRSQANREKGLVALSSLGAACALTLMKLAVGLTTNSLGILSEAAHSGLDLVAAGATLWAVRIAARPADPDHTYGHGKFENLSALFETLLLLATCLWIVYEAFSRLVYGQQREVSANVWAFGVILVSIAVDVSRSRALLKVARKYQSQALEADALHFSTDVWSSCVVLAGLFGVLLAEKLGLPWLVKADSAAALGVAGIVVWVSLRLGKKSVDDLLDRVPGQLRDQVAEAAAKIPGVEDVTQVRMRRSGGEVFADLTLSVGRTTSFEKSHEIADRAEEAVRAILPGADVVVHTEPIAPAGEDFGATVQLAAARLGLGVHGIHWFDQQGQQSLELDVEVDERLSLEEAHRQATQLERALRQALPNLERIVTHIEPARAPAPSRKAGPRIQQQIEKAVAEFLRQRRLPINAHDFQVQSGGAGLSVSFHCTLDPATAITDAHDLTQQIETHLRNHVPDLRRVVIHVEPPGEA